MKHKRRSRLPKRVIQKQRDALFIENLLLKVGIEMARIQTQCIIASIPPKPIESGLVEGGIVAEISLGLEGIKNVIELAKTGPDAYEATIPARKQH